MGSAVSVSEPTEAERRLRRVVRESLRVMDDEQILEVRDRLARDEDAQEEDTPDKP